MINLKKLTALILSLSLIFACLSCSEKLPAETLPPPTTASEQIVETEETQPPTTEETAAPTEEPTHGPCSTAVVTDRVVDINGQLAVDGTNLVNENGEIVQLKGMSTYGMNMMSGFVTQPIVQTLAEDWGCSVIRLAMTTEGTSDGYSQNPEKYYEQMVEYVQLCIDQGVYVIIDWHILFDGDPNEYKDLAVDFFSRISELYGEYPNVIYEICNEPNGPSYDNPDVNVDWDNHIRPYAEEVVSAIRANDPDNIIIIGTSTWSQDVDIASMNPLEGDNLMYTFHFYSGSHGQERRDKVLTALDNGIAVFCTEWGMTGETGNGSIYPEETMEWINFMDEHNISWCNWSIGGAQIEGSNALKYQSAYLTVEEKLAGHWPDEFLSASGLFVRNLILGRPNEI